MKSSIFIAATSAVMAMAGPMDKRSVETEVVVEYYTVTVTGDAPATTAPALHTFFNGGHHHTHPIVSTTSTTTPTVVAVTEASVETTPVVEVPAVAATSTTVYEVTTPVYEATTPTTVATAVATATAVANAPSSDMASTALDAHNTHRANHSAPAMAWLDEIAGYAQNTANTCNFAHDMTQGSGNYGQNIAMWATSDNAAALGEAGAIGMASHDMWYNGEVNKFLPGYYGASTPDMSDFESWGHFSQLVWKDSTSLGCYAKLCAKGTMYDDMDAWYMVCNYRPAGNMGGSYGSNILKPLGESTVTNA